MCRYFYEKSHPHDLIEVMWVALDGSLDESRAQGCAPLLRRWSAACVTCACHVLDFEPCVAQAQTVAM